MFNSTFNIRKVIGEDSAPKAFSNVIYYILSELNLSKADGGRITELVVSKSSLPIKDAG